MLPCNVASRSKRPAVPECAQDGLSAPWRIHFFQRHVDDDAAQTVPGRDFLERCPVAARMAAVLRAVAEAPPNAFAGGGYWEAMHGTMAGYYEVRVDGRTGAITGCSACWSVTERGSASAGRASW